MAKYNVRFSCGHVSEVSLFGPMTDRSRKIAYFESKGRCPACFKAEKAAERAAEQATVAATEERDALPELVGTQSQIAQARVIRANKIAEAGDYIAELGAKMAMANEVQKKAVTDGIADFMGQTDAVFWLGEEKCPGDYRLKGFVRDSFIRAAQALKNSA